MANPVPTLEGTEPLDKPTLQHYLRLCLTLRQPTSSHDVLQETRLKLQEVLHDRLEAMIATLAGVSGDVEQVELAVELLQQLWSFSIGLDILVDSRFHATLQQGLTHPIDKLPRVLLAGFYQFLAPEHSGVIAPLLTSGNILIVLYGLQLQDVGLAQLASKALGRVLVHPETQQVFQEHPELESSPVFQQLQQIIMEDTTGGTLSIRILDCFSEAVGCISTAEGFAFCEKLGMLDALFQGVVSQCHSKDVLLLLNYFVLLEKVSQSSFGATYLQKQQGVLVTPILRLLQADDYPTLTCFAIKLVGNLGSKGGTVGCQFVLQQPWWPQILSLLTTPSQSLEVMSTILECIGNLGSCPVGLAWWFPQSSPTPTMPHPALQTYANAILSPNVELRVSDFHSLAVIYESPLHPPLLLSDLPSSSTPLATFHTTPFGSTTPQGQVRWNALLESRRHYHVDVRMAVFHCYLALARHPSLGVQLASTRGFLDWLTNPHIETELEGKEYKFGIAQALHGYIEQLSAVVGGAAAMAVRVMVKVGPFGKADVKAATVMPPEVGEPD